MRGLRVKHYSDRQVSDGVFSQGRAAAVLSLIAADVRTRRIFIQPAPALLCCHASAQRGLDWLPRARQMLTSTPGRFQTDGVAESLATPQ